MTSPNNTTVSNSIIRKGDWVTVQAKSGPMNGYEYNKRYKVVDVNPSEFSYLHESTVRLEPTLLNSDGKLYYFHQVTVVVNESNYDIT